MSIVPQAVLDAAARLLDASHVEQVADLTTSGRSRVVRLRVAGGSSAGAVLKWGADSAAANACLLEFVQDVVPGLCPGLLGADLDLGFTIQEDLGPGDSLVDVLSGDDPVAAEAALVAHADALGRLAAATRGRFAEWEELVRRRGAPLTLLEPSPSAADILQCWDRVLARLPELGIGGNFGGAEAEFRRALDILSDATEYALSLGDTCPDNNRWDGRTIRLFDVDFCSFRHPLFDAAYYAAPFPTCWFIGAIPPAVQERTVAAYERWIPIDRGSLVLTCCTWTVLNLGWLLEGCIEQDRRLGPVTLRAMLRWRLASSAASAAALGTIPALADLFVRLRDALAARWAEAEPPTVYAALRGAP